MEFLDSLVIPQPEYNLNLMNYLLLLGLSILLIYSGILIGSVFMSIFFKKDGSPNSPNNKLSLEYANLITSGSANAFGLGIVPFIAIIFLYAQLLHLSPANINGLLIASFLVYVVGLIFIYRYKKSATLYKIFKNIEADISTTNPESAHVKKQIVDFGAMKNSSGIWGLLLLFFSLWLLIGSISVALESAYTQTSVNVIWVILSIPTTVKLIHFLIASAAGTAISYLFVKFFWQKDELVGETEDYIKYAKKINLRIAMLSSILVPLFFVIDLIITPKYALTPALFGFTAIGIIGIFLVLHFLYAMFRENDFSLIKYSFFIFIITFALIAVKEKTAFGTANKEHVVALNENYKVHKEEFLASLGREPKALDGEELYARCKACHEFDRRLVGPPHKEVLPKYMDNKAALVSFILNPQKINPDYPPMPNQGLKPAEAEAVADYMINYYGPQLEN